MKTNCTSQSDLRRWASRLVSLLGVACIVFGLICTLCLKLAAAELPQTQVIQLDAGWNLVSPQVLPSDPTPQKVFGPLGLDFVAVWSFENQQRRWTMYAREGAPGAEGGSVIPLSRMEIGKGYWVYMAVAKPWRLEGLPPAEVPAVNLQHGWNLIGIPTGQPALTEQVSVLSVLAASGLDFDVILKWERGQYRRFTSSDADVDDFTVFDPDKGHWLHVTSTEAVALKPRLSSSVRADADVPPVGNFPSYEDLEISVSDPPGLKRAPLDAANQTHIIFLPGEDEQQLAIANTGGGILLWRLEWNPTDAASADWLQVAAVAQGVTTIENDVIRLLLDRRNLVQGTYRGMLRLVTTAGNRDFQVVAHVPGVQGEWSGKATIASVNDRQNRVPDVDLHLSFFEDPNVPGLLRGFIDSHNALLWPVDVPLIGHIQSHSGNAFSLSGAYILPPGDQNNPPYDKFAGQIPGDVDLNDVDWNCNGKLYDMNPYPFPIYRAVTLVGELVSASPAAGYRIQGSYREVVHGMLRQPINLEGVFGLLRENHQPFASRSSTALPDEGLGTQPVVVRTDSTVINLQSRTERGINVITDLVLQDVSVGIELKDIIPSQLKISLVGPEGTTVVLHNRADVPPALLQRVMFPSNRRPAEPLSRFVNAGRPTKGLWKLVIENSGTGGTLVTWSLHLQGQPVFDVYGQVEPASGQVLPADTATVLLDGLPIVEAAIADAAGRFAFSRLPGIPLNFTVILPGYEPAVPSMPGILAGMVTPQFTGDCDSPERIRLAAKFRPLPAFPIPAVGTEGFGGRGTGDADRLKLQVRPRVNPGPDLAGLEAPRFHFTGGGALPRGFVTPTVTQQSPVFADLIQVQHAYAASFDIDLAPTNAFGASFDSDDFDPGGLLAALPANREGNFKIEDHNYRVDTGIHPWQWDLSDDCSYLLDDQKRDRHPKPGATGDCAGPRYMITCNIGPQIIPPPNSEVFPMPADKLSFVKNIPPPPQPDPLLQVGKEGIARSRDLILVAGPLAEFWQMGGAQ